VSRFGVVALVALIVLAACAAPTWSTSRERERRPPTREEQRHRAELDLPTLARQARVNAQLAATLEVRIERGTVDLAELHDHLSGESYAWETYALALEAKEGK
jgi:hypothetical protein